MILKTLNNDDLHNLPYDICMIKPIRWSGRNT